MDGGMLWRNGCDGKVLARGKDINTSYCTVSLNSTGDMPQHGTGIIARETYSRACCIIL
jgi:hypothetical protein